jgi:hypothetical protein
VDGFAKCGGVCVTLGGAANCGACGNVCTGGEVCTNQACKCPGPNSAKCNGQCASLNLDEKNCGGCGIACKLGEICLQGGCKTLP